MRFQRSKLYISAIPPFLIGLFVGLLAAIMGVGGGFIMVPAMIYLLRVPTNVVVGTSLFQIVFLTAAPPCCMPRRTRPSTWCWRCC